MSKTHIHISLYIRGSQPFLARGPLEAPILSKSPVDSGWEPLLYIHVNRSIDNHQSIFINQTIHINRPTINRYKII